MYNYGIVYKITCIINGKIYVGKTCQQLMKRFLEHLSNQGGAILLWNAIQKYGKENFIIQEVDNAPTKHELNNLEQFYIWYYKSQDRKIGYNIAPGGEGGDTFSFRSTESQNLTRVKISRGLVGKRKGIPFTEQHCNNLSKALIGRTAWNQGRTGLQVWTEEQRISKSKAMSGEKNHFYGKSLSPEQEEKRRSTREKNHAAKKKLIWDESTLSEDIISRLIRLYLCDETIEFVASTFRLTNACVTRILTAYSQLRSIDEEQNFLARRKQRRSKNM